MEASKSVLLSYGSIFNEKLAAENLRAGPLSESDRLDAIAYLLARQLGVDILRRFKPGYAASAGLARPLQFLTDKNDFKVIDRMKIAPENRLSLGRDYNYTRKVLLRMDVFLARQEWAKVVAESERAENERFDPRQKEQLALRVNLAKEHLEFH
jgi:hypothetical protein